MHLLSLCVAPPVKKFKKMSSSDASPIRVAIDFGLEHLMTDKVEHSDPSVLYQPDTYVWCTCAGHQDAGEAVSEVLLPEPQSSSSTAG